MELRNFRRFFATSQGIMASTANWFVVPARTMAIQYFVHSLPTMLLVMFGNISSFSCEESILATTIDQQLKSLDIGVSDLCVNQTVLNQLSFHWKGTILLGELLSSICLLFFLKSQQKTEKTLGMTILVILVLLRLSATIMLPVKLQLEENLTNGSYTLLELFLYPFKILLWTTINLASFPFSSMTFKNVIVRDEVDIKDIIQSFRGGGRSDGVYLSGLKEQKMGWIEYFLPWRSSVPSQENNTVQCLRHCTVAVDWAIVLFAISTAVHLAIVSLILLPPFLEETCTSGKIDRRGSERKKNKNRKQLSLSRLSYDERLHRQSFADEGFGESLSMETVLDEIATRDHFPKCRVSTNSDQSACHLPEKTMEQAKGQINEDMKTVNEEKVKKIKENIEAVGELQVKIKSLIETNFNGRPFICLPTDVMLEVCDKLFKRNSAHLGYNSSNELLRTLFIEKPGALNLSSAEKRPSKDPLEKLFSWYKANISQTLSPAVNNSTSEDDGYSDDESFINGFRL